MSESMVERVAKAIAFAEGAYSNATAYASKDAAWRDHWEWYLGVRGKGGVADASSIAKWEKAARAAIEGMREPTQAMLDAGPVEPYMDRDVWARMIDAALVGRNT